MENQVLVPADEPSVFFLGPVETEDPLRIADPDQPLIPLLSETLTLDGWSLSFRAWLTLISGWSEWYARVAAEKSQVWEEVGIAECLPLSLAAPVADENLITAASYFWSDTLNAFVLRSGPFSPSLLDVAILCALRPDGDQISAYNSTPVDLNMRKGWSDYLERHNL